MEEGLLIIDTHRSPTIMLEIKKVIENEFRRNDFLYVINTHGHWDHCSGNQIFPDSIIIGHKNCSEFMRQNPANSLSSLWYKKYHLSKLKEKLKSKKTDSREADELRSELIGWETIVNDLSDIYEVTTPFITFDDSLKLELGSITLKFYYCGTLHTNNDIFVFIPEEKVLFTGDLFTSAESFGFTINKMVDVPVLISNLDYILNNKSGVEYVIPGHSKIITADKLIVLRNKLMQQYSELSEKKSVARYIEKLIKELGFKHFNNKYNEFKMHAKQSHYFSEDEFNFLGKKLLWQGRIEQALKIFRLTVNEFPTSAISYDNLAEVYIKRGALDSAKLNYKKSLQLAPYNRNAKEILKILNNN